MTSTPIAIVSGVVEAEPAGDRQAPRQSSARDGSRSAVEELINFAVQHVECVVCVRSVGIIGARFLAGRIASTVLAHDAP